MEEGGEGVRVQEVGFDQGDVGGESGGVGEGGRGRGEDDGGLLRELVRSRMDGK